MKTLLIAAMLTTGCCLDARACQQPQMRLAQAPPQMARQYPPQVQIMQQQAPQGRPLYAIAPLRNGVRFFGRGLVSFFRPVAYGVPMRAAPAYIDPRSLAPTATTSIRRRY